MAQRNEDCDVCCSRSKVLEGSEVQTPVSNILNGVGHQSHVLGAVATGSDQTLPETQHYSCSSIHKWNLGLLWHS